MNHRDRQRQKLAELSQQWQDATDRIEAVIEQIETTTDEEQRLTLDKRLQRLQARRDELEPALQTLEAELEGKGTQPPAQTQAELDRLATLLADLLAGLDELTYSDDDLNVYLDFLIQQCATLDPRRMRSGGGAVQQVVIPLEEVFVSLHADHDNPLEREADRRLLELDVEALAVSERLGELNEEQRHHFRYRVLVNEWLMLGQRRERPDKLVHLTDVFGRRRYLVILGDPGSGKTTLCRWLALQFARVFKDGQPRVLIRRPDQEKAVDLGPTRLPILLRVADYAQARQDEPDLPLADYLGRQPVQGQAPPLAPETLRALFGDYLEREQAVVLLDGLDEITDPGERNEIVRAIEGFIAANVRAPEGGSMLDDWQARLGQDGAAADLPTLRRRWSREAQSGPAESGGSQVVVTSRVAGYRAAPLRGDLAHFTIQDMDDEAVRRFCERWTLAVERFLLRGEDLDDEAVAQRAAGEAAALLDAIQASPGVRKLATNPLLLTILALIHRDQTRLPEQRVQLYQQTVKTLVELWRDTGLSEAEVIDVLGPLALWIHEHQPTGLATEGEVRDEITRALAAWHGHDPARLPGKFKRRVEVFMRAVREQSGLLVARGEGLYGFMHLTFQEYFVARELTRDAMTAIENIQQRLHLPRWREPLLLAVAYLSEAQRGAMDRVMLGLLDAPADYEQTLHRNLLFAAACIPDAVWVPPRYARRIVAELVELYADERAGGRYPTLRGQIADALRPLRRDDNAARIVDELLTQALADDARRLIVARLVRSVDWHTPAVARALLRALPHDAAPDWPLDAGLAQIAEQAPEALPADRLPFRAACLAEPALWEKLGQSNALRALILALYGAGYPFEAERIYRDSPLTPTILAILQSQDESPEQALVEALEPLLEQDELHYVETQVALVALGQSETVTARLQADAALPQIQPAVQATALRLLDFTRRADLADLAIRDDFNAHDDLTDFIARANLTIRAARADLVVLANFTTRADRADLDALVARAARAALDALVARAARAARAVLDPRADHANRADHADQVRSMLWRALASDDIKEQQEALDGLLSQARIPLKTEHLNCLTSYMTKFSPWGGKVERLLRRLRGDGLTDEKAQAALRRWPATPSSPLPRHAALLLAEAGTVTPDALPHLVEALCTPDDVLRYRAGEALQKRRKAGELGIETVEHMARLAEGREGEDAGSKEDKLLDLRVTTRLDWALKAIEHDDGAALRGWVETLAGPESEAAAKASIPGAILGRIRHVTPQAFPELLAGLRRDAPRLQRALLDSVAWLLRQDHVPETHQAALAQTLRSLATGAGDKHARAEAIGCIGHVRKPSSREVETLLTCLDDPSTTAAACVALARLVPRLHPLFAALDDKAAFQDKLVSDLGGGRSWRPEAAGDAVALLLATPPFQAAESVGDLLTKLGDWESLPGVEELALEVARQRVEKDDQVERHLQKARAAFQKLREDDRFPLLLAALQDAHAHPGLLSRVESALRSHLAHAGAAVALAAGGAWCRLALAEAPGDEFQPGPLLDDLSDAIPDPTRLLRALLHAGTDNDLWDGESESRRGYHARVVSCLRALVESQPALLDDLLKALETALEGDEWPPRRAALAAIAAVAHAMPAHLNQARSPGELESLLVRGTTDAESFTARRMALSALSHLRVATSRVVPALLAAAQDVGAVQRDAIEAAARFRRVEAEALPALTRELYNPSAATAHTVALLLAELGAGRQALDEQDLRRDVVQALAEALADPSNRREVWLERAVDIELVGWLDETLFGALNRVVG